MVLKDSFGRPLLNLRIAVTARCNHKCSYCHAEGEEESQRNSGEMTTEEITRIARVAINLEISRIKLTGGEPLVRNDLADIVRHISSVPGLIDLSMTTNGTLLAQSARKLRENGLQRINISLPTLNPTIYNDLTGGNVEDALKGVKAAKDAGFSPIKVNMLILNGINDNDVQEMIEFSARNGTVLQLIELEPINMPLKYYLEKHKSLAEYETMLRQKASKVETRRFMQNRHIYFLPEAKVEVIRPIENTEFCLHCTRLRVTSDGKLKPCLMKNENLTDILGQMRNGASDEELTQLFKSANENRQPFRTSSCLLQNQ